MRHQNSTCLIAFAGILFLAGLMIAAPVLADNIATLRGGEINQEAAAPMLGKVVNKDLREVRNYPEQPPTIPHKIRGYQINLKANKCLSCHSRRGVGQSQAPMVSITHFMDRDGQTLSAVTPRRFFCTQCHVPQRDVKPLVANDFKDAETVIKEKGN